jgi:hypothetical protein
MVSKRFQDLDVYRLAEKLSEEIWNIVQDLSFVICRLSLVMVN